MNYLILNGTNSNTIPGLIISSLPPITKPEMRVAIDEIDGKDGDQITKLGYSAYDKEIEIGLSYNYDVNQVLAFFNTEGIVTFSNEPDKYYRYTIVDQIDLEKLIRFKTAKVTMHVQPFKYELTEEEKKITTTETSFEGTNIQITGSEFGGLITDQKYKGQTEQRTTIGYNMLPPGEAGSHTVNGLTHTSDGKGMYTLNGTASSASGQDWAVNPYTIKSGDYLYLCNFATNSNVTFALLTDENTQIMYTGPSTANRIVSLNAYAGQTINYVRTRNATQTLNNFKMSPMICDTTTRATFEEFTDGPAPNPSYPQEVKVTRGSQKIEISSKNWIANETFVQGSYLDNTSTIRISCRNSKLKANTTYTLSSNLNYNNFNIEIVTATGQFPLSNNSSVKYDSGWKSGNFSFTTGNEDVYINIAVKKLPDGVVINPNDVAGYHFQIEKGTTATSYVKHYEQEFELDLPVENLFNKNDSSLIFDGFPNRSSLKLETNTTAKTICLPCQPNTTYTVSKVASARFYVDETASSTIASGITIAPLSTGTATGVTNYTVTTSSNAKYLLIYYYVSSADTKTEEEIRDSIQIETRRHS